MVYTSNLEAGREALASKLEGNVTRFQVIGETCALDGLAMSKGNEVLGLARAAVVVPDKKAVAQVGILGVKVSLEGVVVDAPITVDWSLVASKRSRGDIRNELGGAGGRKTDVALLPGLELNAGNGESGVRGHRESGHGGNSLKRISDVALFSLVGKLPW